MYTYVHIYAIHTIIHVDIFVEEDHFANFVMVRDLLQTLLLIFSEFKQINERSISPGNHLKNVGGIEIN